MHRNSIPPPELIAQVSALYEAGHCLEAFRAASGFLPLKDWRGTAGRILAGRLAALLGAERLSRAHFYLAARGDPSSLAARGFWGGVISRRRGPWAAWKFFEQWEDRVTGGADERATWFAFGAGIAADFRDGEAAEAWQKRAEDTDADNPWIVFHRAIILTALDRREEAVAVAERALALKPWYRPAVGGRATFLMELGREDEAVAFLGEALRHFECGSTALQLASCLVDLERFDESSAALDEVVRLSPLMEDRLRRWIFELRANIAIRCGDIAAAKIHAGESKESFYQEVVRRLESQGNGAATILPVGFVRQHQMTCGPATLATLSLFWAVPADHVRIADEICYDGTSSHVERSWAVRNGFAVREFTVTPASLAALIARGVPFTLTTSVPGSAHLQAVIGWDERCGVAFVRDPGMRGTVQFLVPEALDCHRSTGPRGMAFVPESRRELLEGIDLPDAALWDLAHDLTGALLRHDRAAAERALAALQAAGPSHRMALEAARRLSEYDEDFTGSLDGLDTLLLQFPSDPVLESIRVGVLRRLGRGEELRTRLASLCEKSETSVFFRLELATDLANDFRTTARADEILTEALRRSPQTAQAYHTLANLRWAMGSFAESIRLYRIASCLEPTNEGSARSYFSAARSNGDGEAALAFLRARFDTLGRKSWQCARALVDALQSLHRDEEAVAIVDEAIARYPEDGNLLLFAANVLVGTSAACFLRAEELLAKAKDRSPRLDWLRTDARLANLGNDLQRALSSWREVVAANPLDADAHGSIANLLGRLESRPAAVAHVEAARARFPNHRGLSILAIEWAKEGEPGAAEAAMRRFLEFHPHDSWGRRELGFLLVGEGRCDEAAAEAETAARIEPSNVAVAGLRGLIAERCGRRDEAMGHYKDALRRSVGYSFSLEGLLRLAENLQERRAALVFVRGEILRQATCGDAILSLRSLALDTLSQDEIGAWLQEFTSLRPDLWNSWSALASHQSACGHAAEALATAEATCLRFPLLPRAWYDLALVKKVRGDVGGEVAALSRALEISPRWSLAIRGLADSEERSGQLDAARLTLEKGISWDPLDSDLRAALAWIHHRLGRSDASLSEVEQVLALDPASTWGWEWLKTWGAAARQPERAVRAARELCRRRPSDARSFLALARMLEGAECLAERLDALERGIALNPRFLDLWLLKSELLLGAGRVEEALQACQPPAWSAPPAGLRIQAAAVEAERGRSPAARAILEAVARDEPENFMAWMKLADRVLADGDHARSVDVCRQLVRLRPEKETAYGYLGDALHKAGRRAEARDALSRAIAINPGYSWGAATLFDLELEDRDAASAAKTLAHLKTHAQGAMVSVRTVRHAAFVRAKEEAFAAFQAFVGTAEAERWAVEACVSALLEAGWADETDRVLETAALAPASTSDLVAAWIKRCTAAKRWRSFDRLLAMRDRPAVIFQGLYDFVEAFVDAHKARSVRRFLRRRRKFFQGSTGPWGIAVKALDSRMDFAEAARWAADWRKREGAETWMLCNAAEALREAGAEAEGRAIHAFELTLPRESCSVHPEIWTALEALLDGSPDCARRGLAAWNKDALSLDYRILVEFTESLFSAVDAPPEGRRSAARLARHQVLRSFGKLGDTHHPKTRRRLGRRILRRLADLEGGWLARVRHLLFDLFQ